MQPPPLITMAAYQKLKKRKKKKIEWTRRARSGKVLGVNQPKRLGFILHEIRKIGGSLLSQKKEEEKIRKSGKKTKLAGKVIWESAVGV
jgi:hypothetical protein